MHEDVRLSGIWRTSRLREIPETRTTSYMLKDIPERNALLAGYLLKKNEPRSLIVGSVMQEKGSLYEYTEDIYERDKKGL